MREKTVCSDRQRMDDSIKRWFCGNRQTFESHLNVDCSCSVWTKGVFATKVSYEQLWLRLYVGVVQFFNRCQPSSNSILRVILRKVAQGFELKTDGLKSAQLSKQNKARDVRYRLPMKNMSSFKCCHQNTYLRKSAGSVFTIELSFLGQIFWNWPVECR